MAEGPAANTVTYTYDLAGRRTGVSDTSAAITPISAASPVQYATTMTYDARNRPTGVSWTPAPTAVTPTASSVTFAHSYNAVNQRTGQTVTDSGANVWIDYPSGPTATTSYTANALNQYTAVAAVTSTYDGNGNLLDDGTNRYGYDPENRLVSLSPSGSGTACVTACYTFDGRGRRKTKTVGTATTVSITDADNREVLEYDGSTGAILRWYAYGLGPNALLNQMDVAGGTRTSLLPDQLGSIIGKMDSGGGTVGSFAYRSYGKSSSAPATFGYTGQKIDAESGNYYYRARLYSPGWGRFLQADPIGHQGGMHLYAYVLNDPLNLVDRSGEAPGDPYPSVREAGIQAVRDINPTSIITGNEYAGRIYRTSEGIISYTAPVAGNMVLSDPYAASIPSRAVTIGDYHTHGNFWTVTPQGPNNAGGQGAGVFSPGDIERADNYTKTPSYLGTPAGTIYEYIPNSGATTGSLVGGGALPSFPVQPTQAPTDSDLLRMYNGVNPFGTRVEVTYGDLSTKNPAAK